MRPAPRSLLPLLVLALAGTALLALGGCGGDDGEQEAQATTAASGECEPAERPAAKQVDLRRPHRVLPSGKPATAVVETSCGSFEIGLDTAGAPKTANSFAYLAESGVYDGTWFHRIVPGFVVQGGDPRGDGTGGPGYSVDEVPPDDAGYLRGTVAMAKTAVEPPGRSGSQFFVVTAADAGLPPDYAVLGEVTEGLDVVERIGELGDPETEQPLQPVVIERVTVERGRG